MEPPEPGGGTRPQWGGTRKLGRPRVAAGRAAEPPWVFCCCSSASPCRPPAAGSCGPSWSPTATWTSAGCTPCRWGAAPLPGYGDGKAGPGVSAAFLCSACDETSFAVLEAGSAPARCLGLQVLAWKGGSGSRAAALWALLVPVFGC